VRRKGRQQITWVSKVAALAVILALWLALTNHPWIIVLLVALAVLVLVVVLWRYRKRLPRYKFAGRHWTKEEIWRLSPHEFERLVAQVYRELGFRAKENPYRSADGGIDILLERDGARIVVQCKRWVDPVTVKPIRELWGVKDAMKADGAIFVTTGAYTRAAEDWADKLPGFDLIDGRGLLATIDRLSTASGHAVTKG
jgi:restriction system protein